MRKLNRAAAGLVATVAAMATSTTMLAAPSEAAPAASGNKSLAKVLAADGTKFDKKWGDFDITEAAVLAVLKAKPDSPVALLTKGRQRATAFIPTDRAFRRLVGDLTGSRPATERATFKAVATLGVDTIETVLLYHVVPGRTLGSKKVVASAGKDVKTAAGVTFKVVVKRGQVILVDQDRNDRDARAIPKLLDINKGNKQIGHGINQVLRPADL
ncbi:fasciclin domain-containing protein [Nocardioides lijunqiniae]|uniref:fasciclin domain-containing protein n=1 Tax=Nocardioides lijunqiniae TaxID=2760832 RepID=UPI00187874F1|nr:fasciclin domain-containing protein [Nocardioides lijunqiniae]